MQVVVSETLTDDDYYEYKHYGTFTFVGTFTNCISSETISFTVDVDQVGYCNKKQTRRRISCRHVKLLPLLF